MQGLGLRTLFRNFAATFGRQLGAALLQLVTAAIIARVYGPEGNGAYTMALLLPSLLATFLNLGIAPANVYFLGSGQATVRDLLHANLRIYVILIGIGMVTSAIILFWKGANFFPGIDQKILWLALVAFPLSLLQGFLISIFQGLQQFRIFNLILLVQPLIMVLLVGIFAILGMKNIYFLVGINIFTGFVVTILTIWQLKPMLGAKQEKYQPSQCLRQVLSYGWKAHLGNIFQFINYKTDIFLINIFIGPAFAGIYVIAVALVEKLWLVSQAVSTILLPHLSQLASEKEKCNILTPLICRWVLLITLVGGLSLAVIVYPFTLLVFGSDYLESVLPSLILLPGIIFVSGARVLANDIASKGRPELNMYISAITVLYNVVGNWLLIPTYGLVGAAIATTIAYSNTLFLTLLIYTRFSSNHWIDSLFLKPSDIRMMTRALSR